MTQELFCLLVGLGLMLAGSWYLRRDDYEYEFVNTISAVGCFFGFCFFCYGLSCAIGGYASHLPSMWGKP